MRQADALEVEITPEMIEAAVSVISNWDFRFDDLSALSKDMLEAGVKLYNFKGK